MRRLPGKLECGVLFSRACLRIRNHNGAVGAKNLTDNRDHCRMHMHAICDKFAHNPRRDSKRAQRARLAVKKRAHGVAAVRHVSDSQADGVECLFIGGVGVADANGNARLDQSADDRRGAGQFWRNRDETQMARGQCQQFVCLVQGRQAQPRGHMSSSASGVDVGAFEVDTHRLGAGAVLLTGDCRRFDLAFGQGIGHTHYRYQEGRHSRAGRPLRKRGDFGGIAGV
jgi:hypothetical protein